jgi:hypothetical protein
MNTALNSVQSASSYQNVSIQYQQIKQGNSSFEQLTINAQFADTVEFGGSNLSPEQVNGIILERALEKLSGIVAEAREALGLAPEAELDTSPEATGNRIADFALGFFGQFQQNNPELSEEDAKQQFIDLIGGAIQQGISEARDILSALSAINDEVDNNISSIEQIIQQRFDAFLGAGSDSDSVSLLA